MAGKRHPAETRERARRLIFEEECTIAEAARSVGVAWKTVKLWFPDAPRMTRKETSEWANYCRYSRMGMGL